MAPLQTVPRCGAELTRGGVCFQRVLARGGKCKRHGGDPLVVEAAKTVLRMKRDVAHLERVIGDMVKRGAR